MLAAVDKGYGDTTKELMKNTKITPKEYDAIDSAIGKMYFPYGGCPMGYNRDYDMSTQSISR